MPRDIYLTRGRMRHSLIRMPAIRIVSFAAAWSIRMDWFRAPHIGFLFGLSLGILLDGWITARSGDFKSQPHWLRLLAECYLLRAKSI